MARYPFPQEVTSFLYTGPGEPIRQPWPAPLTIYVDQACTTLADIETPAQQSIAGSIIYIGSDGLIPQFLGPNDGSVILWAKPNNAPAYPLTVQLAAYVQQIVAGVATAMVSDPKVFTKQGPLSASYQSPAVVYNDSTITWSVESLRASVGTAPVGSPLTVTLRKESDLSVIGSVSIAAGTHTALFTPTTPYSIVAGEGITVSIDAVGSSVPGSDLTLQLNITHPVG